MISPITSQRISKIIPRLASGHDGEVVASVRAIERILAQNGHDWHALASLIGGGDKLTVHRSAACRPWKDMPRHWQAHLLTKLLSQPGLSGWEEAFLRSVAQKFRQGFPLSTKQIAVIERLTERERTQQNAA